MSDRQSFSDWVKCFHETCFLHVLYFRWYFATVYSTFIKQHQQDVPITAISFMVHKVKFMSVSLDKIKNKF